VGVKPYRVHPVPQHHSAQRNAYAALNKKASRRVNGHVQSWIIICRANANATAGARPDPVDSASYAVAGRGKEVARPSVANKPVEGGTTRCGKSESFSPKFAP
jgi:hypothetical protein